MSDFKTHILDLVDKPDVSIARVTLDADADDSVRLIIEFKIGTAESFEDVLFGGLVDEV